MARCSSFRVSISFTGAPAFRASSAQITPSLRAPNLAPKPPPMNSVITRTFVSGIPKCPASSPRTLKTPWVEAQTVSLSPSHWHTLPWVSSAMWDCTWHRKVASRVTSAWANPAAMSPCSPTLGSPTLPRSLCTWAASGSRAASSSTTKGQHLVIHVDGVERVFGDLPASLPPRPLFPVRRTGTPARKPRGRRWGAPPRLRRAAPSPGWRRCG